MKNGKPHVVILGAGFGGLEAARTLQKSEVEITIIDRNNHHLFQPLLYQVAIGILSPDDIAVPIRYLFRHYPNVTTLMGEIGEIDLKQREIDLGDRHDKMTYDYLIIATGARHSYFRHPEWESYAPGLKNLRDALVLRKKILSAFEKAECLELDQGSEEEIQSYLNFVIVGGGPTGCELAGIMPETFRCALMPDYRYIQRRRFQVYLIEAGERVLASFPEKLGRRAQRDLEALGVTILTKTRVTHVTENEVTLSSGSIIPSRTVIWAAGNMASPIIRDLQIPLDETGRARVTPTLDIPDHPEVFVIGDLANITQKDGSTIPGVAQGAIQMGRVASRNILHHFRGEPLQDFRYRDRGNLAILGRRRAIADFGWLRFSGVPAFLIWIFVHIMFLIGFRNKLSVLLQWGYSYLTYQRGVRLLYGEEQKS